MKTVLALLPVGFCPILTGRSQKMGTIIHHCPTNLDCVYSKLRFCLDSTLSRVLLASGFLLLALWVYSLTLNYLMALLEIFDR